MKPRALLLDFGGVLTGDVIASFEAFCADERIDPATFKQALLGAGREADSIFARVEVGALGVAAFDRELAALISTACGVAVEPAGLKERLFARARPDERMMSAVVAARRSGVRTGLLSNSWGGAGYPRDRFDELFDAVVISGEVGLRKPDARIYRLAAERAGVTPEECVFVDDFMVNVEGAEAVGMRGVLHRSADQTLPLLGDLFGLALESG